MREGVQTRSNRCDHACRAENGGRTAWTLSLFGRKGLLVVLIPTVTSKGRGLVSMHHAPPSPSRGRNLGNHWLSRELRGRFRPRDLVWRGSLVTTLARNARRVRDPRRAL